MFLLRLQGLTKYRNVRYTAEKDDALGYFAQAMTTIYQEAEEMKGQRIFHFLQMSPILIISGTGYKNAVMNKLEQSVKMGSKKSPFIQMADSSANTVHHKATLTTKSLDKDCTKIFRQIFDQFGSMLDNTPDLDGSVAEVKGKLAKYLAQAEQDMKTMVERLTKIEKNPSPKGIKNDKESSPAKKIKQEKDKPIKSEPTRLTRSVKIKAEKEDN